MEWREKSRWALQKAVVERDWTASFLKCLIPLPFPLPNLLHFLCSSKIPRITFMYFPLLHSFGIPLD